MTMQELIDQAAVRVAPSADGLGAKRERRAMIPASRIAWFEREWKQVTRHYDSSESLALERRLWALWETFKGTRR